MIGPSNTIGNHSVSSLDCVDVPISAIRKLTCGARGSDSVALATTGTVLQLQCPVDCIPKGGTVYGSQGYGLDSSICLAAVHSGALVLSTYGSVPDDLLENNPLSNEMNLQCQTGKVKITGASVTPFASLSVNVTFSTQSNKYCTPGNTGSDKTVLDGYDSMEECEQGCMSSPSCVACTKGCDVACNNCYFRSVSHCTEATDVSCDVLIRVKEVGATSAPTLIPTSSPTTKAPTLGGGTHAPTPGPDYLYMSSINYCPGEYPNTEMGLDSYECREKCNDLSDCTSYMINTDDGECLLSTTCTAPSTLIGSNPYLHWLKGSIASQSTSELSNLSPRIRLFRQNNPTARFVGCFSESALPDTFHAFTPGREVVPNFDEMQAHARKLNVKYFAMARYDFPGGGIGWFFDDDLTYPPDDGTESCFSACDAPNIDLACGCANDANVGYPNNDCALGTKHFAVYGFLPKHPAQCVESESLSNNDYFSILGIDRADRKSVV